MAENVHFVSFEDKQVKGAVLFTNLHKVLSVFQVFLNINKNLRDCRVKTNILMVKLKVYLLERDRSEISRNS